MSYPHGGAGQIFRDTTGGLPHNPVKAEIRDWGRALEAMRWPTRADLASNISSLSLSLSDGDVVAAGGLHYKWETGATAIPDLPGLVPADIVTPQHFADLSDGDDISSALNAALTYAFQNNRYRIGCMPGRWLVGTRVDVDMGSSGNPVRPFFLDFSGAILEVPATNTAGCLKITKQNNFQQLRIRNLEIQSAASIGTYASPTNGVGLHLYSALRPGDTGWGTPAAKEVVLENVHIVSKAPALYGRWDLGIVIDGFWFPELRGCWAATRHPGDDTGTDYEVGDGIRILNCWQPTLVSCRASGRWTNGIKINENEDFGYEDFQITGCYSEGAKDALTITMSSASAIADTLKQPGGRISGGHFNGHHRAIRVEHRRQFTIDGPLLYLTIGSGKYTYGSAAFVYLKDCRDATVSVMVPEGGHYNSDTDCSRHVHLLGNSDYIKIRGCEFGADGIAIANNSTGTHNVVEGNVYESYGGPGTSGPTKRFVNSAGAGQLTGGDVPVQLTPTLTFGGASTGITYSDRNGFYVKHGRQVVFSLEVALTSKGTSTGDAVLVGGLPAPISAAEFGFEVAYSSAMVNGILGGVINSSGNLELYRQTTSGTVNALATDADFNNTTILKVSGSYVSNE